MKKILTLLLTITSISAHASTEEIMWQSAYEGDYELAHKLMLTRESEDINDDLFKLFFMAYVCYKTGCEEDPTLVFKAVDQYIEETLLPVRE
jgi:hypothetical protein